MCLLQCNITAQDHDCLTGPWDLSVVCLSLVSKWGHTLEIFFEPIYFFDNPSISGGKTAACHVFGPWQPYECD